MKSLVVVICLFVATVVVNAQSEDRAILAGTVYDANGAVVSGAKVVATDAKGENFETTTSSEGEYLLNLPFNKYYSSPIFTEAKYQIAVNAIGFKVAMIKDFVFIPTYSGKMQLDVGLEIAKYVDKIECPLAEPSLVETSDTKINESMKISARPLLKEPTKINKKKKNN